MHPAPMEKHTGHEGEGCRNRNGLLRKRGLTEDNGWDGTVLKCEELGRLLREIHLVKKYNDTDANEDHRDDGSPLGRIIVVERNHDVRYYGVRRRSGTARGSLGSAGGVPSSSSGAEKPAA